MAYVGDTRSRKLLAKLAEFGIGQIIIRGRLNGRRMSRWSYDNGAFEDWKAGREFDGTQFMSDVSTFAAATEKPDFLVLPDRVAEGLASLRMSMEWVDRLRDVPVPKYLAVQDGMTPSDLPWGSFDGIFIGGELDWKVRTAESWVNAAHEHGVPCHYARCGTAGRVSHARAIGADSLDSSLPLWSKKKCASFLGALQQVHMFACAPTLAEVMGDQ